MSKPSLFEILRSPYGAELIGAVKTAAIYHELEKDAAFKDVMKQAVSWGTSKAKQHAPQLIGAGLGAGIAFGVGLATQKRYKKGQPSLMEQDANKTVLEHGRETAQMKREKKDLGFVHKMKGVQNKGYQGMARVMAEHPGAGIAVSTAFGAAAGKEIATMATDTFRHLKEKLPL